jgi:hypothetical protein
MGANRNDPAIKAKRAQALRQVEHAGQARARRRAAVRARFAAAEAAAEAATRRAERDAERAAEKAAYEAEKSANTAPPVAIAPVVRPVAAAKPSPARSIRDRHVPECRTPGCDTPVKVRPSAGADGYRRFYRFCSLHASALRSRY